MIVEARGAKSTQDYIASIMRFYWKVTYVDDLDSGLIIFISYILCAVVDRVKGEVMIVRKMIRV
jgi:hypothetical protein